MRRAKWRNAYHNEDRGLGKTSVDIVDEGGEMSEELFRGGEKNVVVTDGEKDYLRMFSIK